MLVLLNDIKNYLGIPLVDTSYDAFLTEQEKLISDTIEAYCGRKFLQTSLTQTFYKSDYLSAYDKQAVFVANYPIVSITSVKEIEIDLEGNETETILTTNDYRVDKPLGKLIRTYNGVNKGWFNYLSTNSKIEIEFDSGFAQADIPSPIRFVVLSICEEKYNRKKSGIGLNFGSDVQRMSVPGVFSIDFDYTLTKNERKSKFGMLLGDYVNMIDPYRSEKPIIGSIKVNYVS